MRILIDAQGMQGLSAQRGIGRYVASITEAILKVSSEDDEVFLLLNGLFPQSIEPIIQQFEGLLPNHHFVVFEAYKGYALDSENATKVTISELCREKLVADLSPDFLIVASLFEGAVDDCITSLGEFASIPTAVILYDLIPLILKDKYLNWSPYENWYYQKLSFLKKADLLLAISDSAKQEAIEYLQIDENKIVNISSAVDHEIFSPVTQSQQEAVRQKYGITRDFLLFTSAYEQRKNFEGLIEAFSLLKPELRRQYQLVLVCKLDNEKKQQLVSVAKMFKLKPDEYVLTDYVPDSELTALYSSCTLFVFPSFHEGFGLPALEAMSCGAATIGSNTTCIPEVIGREDALFDPYRPKSIAQKIEEVLCQPDFWQALKIHAQKQAEKFSWEKSAKIVLETLKKNISTSKVSQSIRENTQTLIKKIAQIPQIETLFDNDLIHVANIIAQNERTIQRLQAYADCSKPLSWRLEGPFDSSYSLALLNRETARALDELGHRVILHSTEGPGDFLPNHAFLEANSDLKAMYERVKDYPPEAVDVLSRNLYPPRVEDMHAPINMLHHYAWEESAFPQEWVKKFNHFLQGMTCLSQHVEKIMIDNGVKVPMTTSGCGVDHWLRVEADEAFVLQDSHGFRFLHVSSCFPRKGVDVLLKAYGEAFTDHDDVVLVIKTFANPHNEVHRWLEEAKSQYPQYPDVLIIEEDLTDPQLKALYQQCDVLVAPSRAEGFGLPLAEAMLSDLAVITTGWSGQRDFCHEDTAWLIDYQFAPAKTHFNLFNSVWAEPSQRHLAQLMQTVFEMPIEQRQEKIERAKRLLENFTWLRVTECLVDKAREVSENSQAPKLKVAWISTYNTKCGIATYSQHLLENMQNVEIDIFTNHEKSTVKPDSSNVHRCFAFKESENLQRLSAQIEQNAPDIIVIQFNYSFFNFEYLAKFIERQVSQGMKMIVEMHATCDPLNRPEKDLSILTPSLQKCTRVLVHSIKDLNRLKKYGLVENVTLFPLGVLDFNPPQKVKPNKVFTLASYGFFLPHKGLLELIEVVERLRQQGIEVHLKMFNAKYPIPVSDEMIQKANEKIAALNLQQQITLNTDFLNDEVCLTELNKADLIVFAYQETGESASAAVRYGLAAQKPIVVTPLAIFEDVKEVVFSFEGTTVEAIAKGVRALMQDIQTNAPRIQEKQKIAQRWLAAHRYSHLSERLLNMMEALVQQKY